MDQAPQTAILLMSDPLFREALKLLLEDMHFVVYSAGSSLEVEKLLRMQNITPELLVFPLLLSNEKPVIEYVRKIRDRFKHRIPVILLQPDNTVYQPQLTDADLIVLPEQVRPKVLRQKINEITHNTKTTTTTELEHGY